MSLSHPLRASLSLGAAALVAGSLCAAAPAIAAPSAGATASPSGTQAAATSASEAVSTEGQISAAEDVKLSVAVSAPEDREAYQAGEIANYVVTATNDSDQVIPSLTLKGDPSALAGKVRYKNNGPLEAREKTVENLEPGDSVTLKFSLVILMNDDVPPGTVLTVPFSAQAKDAEGNDLGAPSTKRSQIIVDPRGSAVKANFSAGEATEVTPGGEVTYTAKVANSGDTTTGELTLSGDFSDVFDDATLVPGSVTYAGGVGSKNGAPSDVPDTMLWVGKLGYAVPETTARSLVAGDDGSDAVTVSFTVKVKADAPVGATLGAKISVVGDDVTDETCGAGACEVAGPKVVAAPTQEPTKTPEPTPSNTEDPTKTPEPSESESPSASPSDTAQPTDDPTDDPTGDPSATDSSQAPNPGEDGGDDGQGGQDGDGDGLANTGASALLPLGAAAALAAGGAVLVGTSRRRRHG